jgi:hypothetical protein
MSDRKKVAVQLTAAEFMAKHAKELAESEQEASIKLLRTIFPEGPISLARLGASNPALDKWLQARAALPGNRLISELQKYWVIRLLKAAANENSREAYRELLEGLLIRLGVEPPDGVLLPSPRPRGAPHKASTELIYQVWLQNGKPNWNSLAYEFYRAHYTSADAKVRKTLRDRCRRAVKRRQAMLRDE